MSKNKTINDKLAALKTKYRKDAEALAEIARAQETILYYERQGNDEKAIVEINQLEAFLHDWH